MTHNKADNNKYDRCHNFDKCKNLKRKESDACRLCYTKISPYNKQAIIESFGKLFK